MKKFASAVLCLVLCLCLTSESVYAYSYSFDLGTSTYDSSDIITTNRSGSVYVSGEVICNATDGFSGTRPVTITIKMYKARGNTLLGSGKVRIPSYDESRYIEEFDDVYVGEVNNNTDIYFAFVKSPSDSADTFGSFNFYIRH